MDKEIKERIFRGEYLPLEDIAGKAKGVSYKATIYMENLRVDHFVSENLRELEKEAYSRAFALLSQNNQGNNIKIEIRMKLDGEYVPLRGIVIRATDISQGREYLLEETGHETKETR